MIITKDTTYDFGDTVAMINDPDENAGIVIAFKILPGDVCEYLVIWNPSMSSWAWDFEIKRVEVTKKGEFGA